MSSLEQLIELARKTGDRLIIHDPQGGRDLVVMDVAQYKQLLRGSEKIADMDERDFVQKLQRDIAVWESNQEEVPAEDEAEWYKVGDMLEEFGQPAAEEPEFDHPEALPDGWQPSAFQTDAVPPFEPPAAMSADSAPVVHEPLPGQETQRNVSQFAELMYEFTETTEAVQGGSSQGQPTMPTDDEPMFFEEPVV